MEDEWWWNLLIWPEGLLHMVWVDVYISQSIPKVDECVDWSLK